MVIAVRRPGEWEGRGRGRGRGRASSSVVSVGRPPASSSSLPYIVFVVVAVWWGPRRLSVIRHIRRRTWKEGEVGVREGVVVVRPPRPRAVVGRQARKEVEVGEGVRVRV